MRYSKKSILGGLATSIVAGIMLFTNAAKSEDFCDATKVDTQKTKEEWEKRVRGRCKVGDIIHVYELGDAARLCDFHQQMISIPFAGGGIACLLAPERKSVLDSDPSLNSGRHPNDARVSYFVCLGQVREPQSIHGRPRDRIWKPPWCS